MQIQMTTVLAGAKKVDYEEYKHVNLFIMVGVKNGDGSMTQQVRFKKGFEDYERVRAMIGKEVVIDAELETKDGKDQNMNVIAIRPVASATNKAA